MVLAILGSPGRNRLESSTPDTISLKRITQTNQYLKGAIASNISSILIPFKLLLKKLVEKINIMKSQFTFTLSGILILISLGGCASGDTVYVEPVGWGFRHRPVFIYEPPDGPDVVQTPLGPEYLQPPPQ